MTDISVLINSIRKAIPFNSQSAAKKFLSTYGVDDQCALISALYIGRDHIHSSMFNAEYFCNDNRFLHTGNHHKWNIIPAEFPRILYEREGSIIQYYDAFLRCAAGSKFNLGSF